MTTTAPSHSRSAAASTACRSRSSSPPPVPTSSRPQRSSPALADRLGSLRRRDDAVAERQRTLRGLLDWSNAPARPDRAGGVPAPFAVRRGLRSPQWQQSRPATAPWTPMTSPRSCGRSSTSRWSTSSGEKARRATSCSRRSERLPRSTTTTRATHRPHGPRWANSTSPTSRSSTTGRPTGSPASRSSSRRSSTSSSPSCVKTRSSWRTPWRRASAVEIYNGRYDPEVPLRLLLPLVHPAAPSSRASAAGSTPSPRGRSQT